MTGVAMGNFNQINQSISQKVFNAMH